MASVPCVCISDLCGHEAGERCGKPVKVKLKLSVAKGESEFEDEFETGICEECWATVTKHYPHLLCNS
jgi:hypothetical protein